MWNPPFITDLGEDGEREAAAYGLHRITGLPVNPDRFWRMPDMGKNGIHRVDFAVCICHEESEAARLGLGPRTDKAYREWNWHSVVSWEYFPLEGYANLRERVEEAWKVLSEEEHEDVPPPETTAKEKEEEREVEENGPVSVSDTDTNQPAVFRFPHSEARSYKREVQRVIKKQKDQKYSHLPAK